MEEVGTFKGLLRHWLPRCSTEARVGKKQLELSRAQAGPSAARLVLVQKWKVSPGIKASVTASEKFCLILCICPAGHLT